VPTWPRPLRNRAGHLHPTARAVTGGCKVLENPDRRGDEAVLFWRSELVTDLVRLVAAPANTDTQLRFDPLRWAGRPAALATDEGLHLILRFRSGTEYRLLLPGPDPPRDGSPLAILIEPNRSWRLRVAAAERFLALAVLPRPPIRSRPSALVLPEEGARRSYILWALDLKHAGASEHAIGATVFGTRVSGAIWSNHADRSELRRLLRAGRSFVSGRYRELLQVQRPR
jgi:hypothetical protein